MMELWLVLAFAFIFICSAIYLLCPLWSPKNYPTKGKHILITGGSSGIGKAIAAKCILGGASTVTILARNKNRLSDAQEELLKLITDPEKQSVACISIDLTSDYDALCKAINQVEEIHGGISMLINCAGYAYPADFEDITPEEFKRQMEGNYLGSVYATKAVIGGMKKRGKGGRIAFTSSQAGQIGLYGYTAYSASKFALRGLAEALQMEVKPYDIRVTVCFPPDTDTPGMVTEDLTKPRETKLISETAGLHSPEYVGEVMLRGIVRGDFQCYVGVDGWMLSCATAGLGPVSSGFDALQQVLLAGILRAVGLFFVHQFDKIVAKCKLEKDSESKSEKGKT